MWGSWRNPRNQPGYANTRSPQVSMLETMSPLGKINIGSFGNPEPLVREYPRGFNNPAEFSMNVNMPKNSGSIMDRFADIWRNRNRAMV